MSSGGLITDYLSFGSGAPSGAPSVAPSSGEWAFYQDTATGDLYVWALNGTPAWVAAGGGSGITKVANASASGSGSADYTSTSTSYADIDGTNLQVNIAAATNDVLQMTLMFNWSPDGSHNSSVTLNVGGTVLGDTLGLLFSGSSGNWPATIHVLHTVASGEISSGHVLVKPQWKVASGGTVSIYNRSAVTRPILSVVNLLH